MPATRVNDEYVKVRGFRVDFDPAGGNEADTGWESVSGGEINSPGHKSVGEITLRGAITDKRGPMCQWITDTLGGRPGKRTVTITPINLDGSIGETVIFNECALTAYRLPRLELPQPNDPCPPDEGQEELRFTYRDWQVRP